MDAYRSRVLSAFAVVQLLVISGCLRCGEGELASRDPTARLSASLELTVHSDGTLLKPYEGVNVNLALVAAEPTSTTPIGSRVFFELVNDQGTVVRKANVQPEWVRVPGKAQPTWTGTADDLFGSNWYARLEPIKELPLGNFRLRTSLRIGHMVLTPKNDAPIITVTDRLR